jgi:alkanesulfonate monooxygenase SsuD/methylene tetrahydromethanopterin reductase-like flavin-dependent oxidoreductase (luciferase family)
VKYGFVLPAGDATQAAELAAIAEQAGWDGFFVWEPVWGVDAWVMLAAAAMRTSRIRLGTMLTPLPRRRPWDLAGQTATLDNLSGGRVILSVGLGAVHEGWLAFETDPGRRVRAELLDEALDVLTGLWAGQPFSYSGRHYTVRPTDLMVPPPPLQQPRIPIWVVGAWPAAKSMRRAARWDGWLPNVVPATPGGEQPPVTPDIVRAAVAEIRRLRETEGLSMDGFDVVVEGTSTPDTLAAEAEKWAAAGATWYIESDWSVPHEKVFNYARARLAAPPVRSD